MKTLFKNITKFAVVFALTLFAGTAMAASFDMDPAASDNYGNNTKFTSINTYHTNGDNLKNQLTNFSSLIPNYNDSEDIYVFVDFKTKSGLITNPNAKIQAPLGSGTSSQVTFTGVLHGGNGAGTITDKAYLQGLPAEYDIQFVKGWNYVDEHILSNNQSCDQTYPGIGFNYYYDNVSSSDVSGGFILPNDLDHQYAQGWCDQGFLVAKYRVTNKYQPVTVDLIVSTQSANVNNDDVTFNGTLNSGTNAQVWFVYGNSSSSLNCSSSQSVSVTGTYSSNTTFSANQYNLAPGYYHYMACASESGVTANGSPVNFQIFDNNNDTYSWNYGSYGSYGSWSSCSNGEQERTRTRSAQCVITGTNTIVNNSNCSGTPITSQTETRSCDDGGSNDGKPDADTRDDGEVTATTADLRGRIRMNDFNDGLVFFVYDTDEDDINDVESSFDDYDEIYGISKVIIDNDNGTNDWRSYHRVVDGLDTGDRYYYQICVEYYDDGDEIECGGVENFRTSGDDNNNDDLHVYTRDVTNVTKTSAKICGSLTNDGQSGIQRWMELRRATNSSWNITDDGKHTDSNGGSYCDNLTGLSPNTKYYYRACRTVYTCGVEKYFTTDSNGVIPNGDDPEVTTNDVPLYSIRANSALLPGTFISHANTAQVWFNYGYSSSNLSRTTKIYTKYGSGGAYTHNFTNLKSNQRYCYQAVVQTVNGKKYGAVKCFYTLPAPKPVKPNVVYIAPTPQPVITVIEDVEPDIDLSRLGLGLSLIRLDIDDSKEQVTNGENITYEITWENISRIDLDDLDLNISIPNEVQILSSSRGRLDQDRNSVFYTINNLDAGEKGSMTVSGIVNDGRLGDALTADAIIAFNNPINDAQENAQDYDVDEFVILTAVGTASVFGLADITLLGWLTILLGLFIVFLVARWLYLEREELRAQAYVNGYGQTQQYMAPVNNHNGYVAAPQQSVQHVPDQMVAPVEHVVEKPVYQAYRPNR